jgi:hypothetical protein
MGKGGDNNGDREDIEESGTWFCKQCGMNGSCVKGDESMALILHEAAEHSSE